MGRIKRVRDLVFRFCELVALYIFDCVLDIVQPLNIDPRRREAFRSSRYLPMGAISGSIDVATISLIVLIYGLDAGLAANIAGALCGYTTSFLLHRNITFAMRKTPIATQLARFVLYKCANLTVRIGGYILVFDFQQYWGAVVTVIILLLWNFLMSRWAIPGDTPLHFYRVMRNKQHAPYS